MTATNPANPVKASRFSESWRDWLKIGLPVLVVGGLAFIAAWHFVQPAPPKHVVIATGSSTGKYYSFGKQYHDYFHDNGVELEVRATKGSC